MEFITGSIAYALSSGVGVFVGWIMAQVECNDLFAALRSGGCVVIIARIAVISAIEGEDFSRADILRGL